jgi:hypothetical protein
MMTRNAIAPLVLLAAVAGCAGNPGGTNATNKEGEKAPPSAADVFQKPTPTEAAHDPRVMTLKATTDRITAALTTVRDRLKDMKTALETKSESETDLLKVAGDLKTLTGQAREDCDAIIRTAKDLREALLDAPRGYAVAAELYRGRAARLTDPTFRDVNLRMADEFDRLAAVTPQRVELTDRFIVQLADVQEFLAQADRCLGDTKTALEILTAGPSPVTVTAGSKAFRRHLEQFLALIEEYQQKLLAPPPVQPQQPKPKPESKSEDAATPPVSWARPGCPRPERLIELDVPAGVTRFHRYYCPECRELHVAGYTAAPGRPGYAQLSHTATGTSETRAGDE